MGGLAIRIGGEQSVCMDPWISDVWYNVIKQAGLQEDFNVCVSHCCKDVDGECEKNGCLQKFLACFRFSIKDFLDIHKKAKKWLEDNPDFKREGPEHGFMDVDKFIKFKEEKEKINEIIDNKKLAEQSMITDYQQALIVFDDIIEVLSKTSAFYEKGVLLNQSSDNDLYPCARELVLENETECAFLDYYYTKKHLKELKKYSGSFEGVITREEAIKKGIIFVEE